MNSIFESIAAGIKTVLGLIVVLGIGFICAFVATMLVGSTLAYVFHVEPHATAFIAIVCGAFAFIVGMISTVNYITKKDLFL